MGGQINDFAGLAIFFVVAFLWAFLLRKFRPSQEESGTHPEPTPA